MSYFVLIESRKNRVVIATFNGWKDTKHIDQMTLSVAVALSRAVRQTDGLAYKLSVNGVGHNHHHHHWV